MNLKTELQTSSSKNWQNCKEKQTNPWDRQSWIVNDIYQQNYKASKYKTLCWMLKPGLLHTRCVYIISGYSSSSKFMILCFTSPQTLFKIITIINNNNNLSSLAWPRCPDMIVDFISTWLGKDILRSLVKLFLGVAVKVTLEEINTWIWMEQLTCTHGGGHCAISWRLREQKVKERKILPLPDFLSGNLHFLLVLSACRPSVEHTPWFSTVRPQNHTTSLLASSMADCGVSGPP